MIIACPHCAYACQVPRTAVGKRAKCPSCSQVFTVEVPQAQVLEDEPQEQKADEVVRARTPASPQPAEASPGAAAAAADRPTEAPSDAERSSPPRQPPPVPSPAPPRSEAPASAPAAKGRAHGQGDEDAIPELEPQKEKQPKRPGWMTEPAEADATGEAAAPQPGKADTAHAAGKAEEKPGSKKEKKDGWFVLTREGEVGPLSSAQVIKAARSGKIKPKTMLRHTRRTKPIRAAEVPGLFSTGAKGAAKAADAGQEQKKGGDAARKSRAKASQPPPQAPLSDDLRQLASAAGEGEEGGLSAEELARVVSGGEEGGLSASGLARELDELEPPSDRRLSASELGRALGEDE